MKGRFFSFLHKVLIKKNSYRFKNKFLRNIWQYFWDFSVNSYKGEITYKLYGEEIKMNNGYTYPLFIHTYFEFNNPLIEITYSVFNTKKKPLIFIDIGAAIGDTILLLLNKCPSMIKTYYCIDGDEEFFRYQKYNLRNHTNGFLIKAFLSDYENKNENKLVRTHLGTASAQGNEKVETLTLDELLLEEYKIEEVDLIKIDVDGLDGKIISGAKQIIEKFRPTIIFEWHPILYNKTGNSTYLPFKELMEQGYEKFFFFNKLGQFSHIAIDVSAEEIEFLSLLCLREKYNTDWHYDVIAINNISELDSLKLAELEYSKTFQ